jgi:hypothetical protein
VIVIEMLIPCWLAELDGPAVEETVTLEVPRGVPTFEVPPPELVPELLQPPPYVIMSDTTTSSIMITANLLRLLPFLRSTPGTRNTAIANVPPCAQSQFEGP